MTWKNRWFVTSLRRAVSIFVIITALIAAILYLILPFFPQLPQPVYSNPTIVLVPSVLAAGASVFLDWLDMLFQRSRLREERIQQLGEQQYRRMVQSVEDYAIYMLDPDGCVVSWNDGAARIKGYTEGEILGKHFSIFYPQDAIEARMPEKQLERATKEGRARSEGWRIRKDGSRFWADVLVVPVYEDRGELVGFTKITRDTTRWYETRRDLELSRQRLEDAQHIANMGSWELDLNLNELVWSDQQFRMLGFKPDEIDPSTDAYLEMVHPDDKGRVEQALQSAFETASDFQFEHCIIRADGEVRIWRARGHVEVDEYNHPIRMIGTNEDITERRELQEAFTLQARLYESIVVGLGTLGQGMLLIEEDRILFANSAVAEILEVDLDSIETTSQLTAQMGVDPASGFGRAIDPQSYGHQAPTDGLISLNGESEKHLEYASTAIGLHDHHHIIVLIRDITQRMEYERELRESSEKLRRSYAQMSRAVEEERARISRQIHDELGQQLTGLKMDLSWLSSKLAEKTQSMADLVDTTVRDVRHLATELRPGILDDLGLLAAIEWQASEFQKRTGINCHIDTDPEIVISDGEITTAMFRIFQEALTNIVRHADAKNVTISLHIDGEGVLELQVADDGRGISEETLYGESPISLGLLGMRERAEIFGGEALIAPGDPNGTLVNVRIPLDTNPQENP